MASEPPRSPVGGTTVHLIGDLHCEQLAEDGDRRCGPLRRDMRALPGSMTGVRVRVQVGDACHNYDPAHTRGLFDAQYPVAWSLFDELALVDGASLVYCVGNHEVSLGGNGDRVAALFGFPHRNYSVDHAGLTFVVYSPLTQDETGVRYDEPATDWVIPADVLAWMDAAIGAAANPVVIVSHCPPYEQYADATTGYYLTPVADIAAMVAAHPNVVAWMSGHRHHWFNDPDLFKTVRYGGHTVALIQAGCCGGTLAAGWRQTGHPVDSVRTNGSVFCTYFDATDPAGRRWELRVRDHSLGTWGVRSLGHRWLWTLPLPSDA